MTAATQSWLRLLTALAALGGFFAWQTHYIDKHIDDLRAELTGLLRSEIGGLRDELKSETAGLREVMNQRFEHVDDRLDRLEHPVSLP